MLGLPVAVKGLPWPGASEATPTLRVWDFPVPEAAVPPPAAPEAQALDRNRAAPAAIAMPSRWLFTPSLHIFMGVSSGGGTVVQGIVCSYMRNVVPISERITWLIGPGQEKRLDLFRDV